MNLMNDTPEVFISYKNTVNGVTAPDAMMAKELFQALTDRGIRTFFSGQSLEIMGADRYKAMIDDALDDCHILIVVGCSVENMISSWVRYEWDSFYNDILMDRKQGRMFSYVENIRPQDLPRTLRNLQCFEKSQTTLDGVVSYVQNALHAIHQTEQNKTAAAVSAASSSATRLSTTRSSGTTVTDSFNPNVGISTPPRNESTSKLLQFANLISCGDRQGQYVNPYISDEMADIIADTVGTISAYDTERCLAEGLNPVLYEVFLAQKIARINEPENCLNSYQILHQVVNSWRVFLNEQYKVVAYWIFIALDDDSYERIQSGQVDEKDICLDDVRFIDMPGRYKGYLLLAGTIEQCRTPYVVKQLYSSWLEYIQELAEDGIFFDEIASMVGSAAGNSSLKNIGMKYYADYISGGKMYKYIMTDLKKNMYIHRNFPRIEELYEQEYGEA